VIGTFPRLHRICLSEVLVKRKSAGGKQISPEEDRLALVPVSGEELVQRATAAGLFHST
jgi:hypothetical protein